MKTNIPLFLECTPMTAQMVCICCHAVRYCKGCCNTCKNECNTKYDCQLNFENDDCSWWNAVSTVFEYDAVMDKQPEKLKEYINKLIKEY